MESHPGDDTPQHSFYNVEGLSDSFRVEDPLPVAVRDNFPSPSPTLIVPLFCRICETPLTDTIIRFDDCDHQFCKECVSDFLAEKIRKKEVEAEFRCPSFQCTAAIPPAIIALVLAEEDKARLEKFRRDKLLEADPYFRWCPRPDCTGYDTIVELGEKLKCNVCGMLFCAYCHEQWHEGQECPEGKDKLLEKWIKENNGKFCPTCKMRIEKNEGCMHMTCTNCGYEWCWRCGENYHQHNNCIATVKRHWGDQPIQTCLVLLFLPLISPFMFVVLSLFFFDDVILPRVSSKCAKVCLFFLTVLVGLAITPLGYAFLLVATGHLVLFDAFQQSVRWGSVCGKILKTLLFLGAGFCINPFVLFGALCFVAVSPFMGFVLLVLKAVFSRRRPPLPKSKVPGYPVT